MVNLSYVTGQHEKEKYNDSSEPANDGSMFKSCFSRK